MRPRERRETGEQDLFRSRLDQIIDMNHALAKLARTVDWRFLEGRFGEVYTDEPGHPPLPTCGIRGKAATDSDGRRPPNPNEGGHPVDGVRREALSAI